MRAPDRPLRQAGSSFAHSFSVFGTLAPLLVLAFAVLLLVLVWRVWGRRRLAAEGRFFEVRLGEQVSRAAVESLMSTVAGGLPRPLLGPAPWVALELSSTEDRAECGLFVSGGVPVAQVRAAVEQGLGGVTSYQPPRRPLSHRHHRPVAIRRAWSVGALALMRATAGRWKWRSVSATEGSSSHRQDTHTPTNTNIRMVKTSMHRISEVPPFGPPFGAPTEGGPLPLGIPHQHSDPGASANPDSDHLFPGGGRP